MCACVVITRPLMPILVLQQHHGRRQFHLHARPWRAPLLPDERPGAVGRKSPTLLPLTHDLLHHRAHGIDPFALLQVDIVCLRRVRDQVVELSARAALLR